MFDFIRKPQLWQAWDDEIASEIAERSDFELKSMQDLAIYAHLRQSTGKRIAEIGPGLSRVLPTLATTNACVAVDKFDGAAAGPKKEPVLPNVRNVLAHLGDHDPQLANDSFDVVFSISLAQHVAPSRLGAFHEDQLRILKPGGMFMHAIDVYLEDEPAPDQVKRFEAYRSWVTASEGVEPVGEIYEGPCRFGCDLATNPDNVMYLWGTIAPSLNELRQASQSVSLLVGGRKLETAARKQDGAKSN